MPITKEQAVQIAKDFIQARQGKKVRPVMPDSAKATHYEGGYGTEKLGMGPTYWGVAFKVATPKRFLMNREILIVCVDEESGQAASMPA